MTQRFVLCGREQVLLMPVSLREWLPENHLAWFVLAAVEELDLSAFYAVYRQARPIPASRPQRLKESKRRLEEELWTACQANVAYEAYRARGVISHHDKQQS
ncbi:MAG: hypothetical protein LC749_10580 [Actinobacteria bacterium]|nr:hypothetical protein [Actinomycetota bacterium]